MKKEGVAGLYFVDHQARMYPNGVFSSHFIGYAVPDKDENGLVGKLGLESAYNDILSGKDGKIIYQKIIFKILCQVQWQKKKNCRRTRYLHDFRQQTTKLFRNTDGSSK